MDEYLVWLDGHAEDDGSIYSDIFPRKAAEAYVEDNHSGGWKTINVNVKDISDNKVYKFKFRANAVFTIEATS